VATFFLASKQPYIQVPNKIPDDKLPLTVEDCFKQLQGQVAKAQRSASRKQQIDSGSDYSEVKDRRGGGSKKRTSRTISKHSNLADTIPVNFTQESEIVRSLKSHDVQDRIGKAVSPITIVKSSAGGARNNHQVASVGNIDENTPSFPVAKKESEQQKSDESQLQSSRKTAKLSKQSHNSSVSRRTRHSRRSEAKSKQVRKSVVRVSKTERLLLPKVPVEEAKEKEGIATIEQSVVVTNVDEETPLRQEENERENMIEIIDEVAEVAESGQVSEQARPRSLKPSPKALEIANRDDVLSNSSHYSRKALYMQDKDGLFKMKSPTVDGNINSDQDQESELPSSKKSSRDSARSFLSQMKVKKVKGKMVL